MYPILPLLAAMQAYTGTKIRQDAVAGLTVGVMVLPQGLAYAVIVGLPPVYGLYAAIVPPLIYMLLGTSRTLSVGPVAMDSFMVAAGLATLSITTLPYIELVLILSMLVGLFQLLLGFCRFGFITNILSKPVVKGFTAAAATLIIISQTPDFMGVTKPHESLVGAKVIYLIETIHLIHWPTFLLSIVIILILYGSKRYLPALPSPLLAVTVGIAATFFLSLDHYAIRLLESIPSSIPTFQLGIWHADLYIQIAPLAFSIAVVGYFESYSIAKALEAERRDHQVVANRELIALGASNLIGSFFQSFPVAGSFSRSAVNDQTGAQTQLSTLFAVATVLLSLLSLSSVLQYLPYAVLAAVIISASSNLYDVNYIRQLWRQSKLETAILLVTFFATLFLGLVNGLLAGISLSILLLIYRLANPHIVQLGQLESQMSFRNIKRFPDSKTWPRTVILRIDAPITFINIQYIRRYIQKIIRNRPQLDTLVIDASSINSIDASGIDGLGQLLYTAKQNNVRILIANAIGPVRDQLFKSRLIELIGTENMVLTIQDALEPSYDGIENRQLQALQHKDKNFKR